MVLTARWQRTLTVVFIAQLTTAVGFSSIFPFLPLYVKALGTTTGLSLELLSGLVFSGQAFTMMLASPVWGALADRFGRKLMVERAMFGGALILLLMAFVRSAEQLVLLRAIQGLITGTISAANALVAAETPRQRTGYAMGLLQVSLGAGVALGPLLGGAIADWLGYRAAFFATAALLFGSGLLVWRGVQEDFIPVERSAHEKGNFLSSWQQITAAPGVMLVYSLRFISQLGRNMLVSVAPLFIQALLLASAQLNFFTGLVVGVSAATTTISAVFAHCWRPCCTCRRGWSRPAGSCCCFRRWWGWRWAGSSRGSARCWRASHAQAWRGQSSGWTTPSTPPGGRWDRWWAPASPPGWVCEPPFR
jgi:DHA1 family multidrug resistance protein-like MFS transporter